MAGFVAENILEKRLNLIYWNDVAAAVENGILIDVRTPGENAKGTIPGSINIPVDELRSRLHELPKYENVNIFCQVGLRGYLAQRILAQNGYANVKNISGGYTTWNVCTVEQKLTGIKQLNTSAV
jgi:rhodanese-related sulfurtransferase